MLNTVAFPTIDVRRRAFDYLRHGLTRRLVRRVETTD
jgi:hypothetical protein